MISLPNLVSDNETFVKYASAAGVAVVTGILLRRLVQSRRGRNLPPGPTPLPIIGNWLDYPNADAQPWLTFLEWSKKYKSDIISLNVWGTPILLLNSHQATVDLLGKRQFNDRPDMPMVNEVLGLSWHFGFMHIDDPRWKEDRKLFHQEYGPKAVLQFRDSTSKRVLGFLQNLLDSPDKFLYHVQHMATGHAAEALFGLQVQPAPQPDPFINVVQQALQALIKTGLFGSYLVDFIPALKFIPGLAFKRQAKPWRQIVDTAITLPTDLLKAQMSKGTAAPSIAKKLLEAHPEDEASIRRVATAAFAQASAAVVSSLQTFFLYISRCPELQNKAQAQLDSLLQGRLPTVNDMAKLPLITAIVKEVLRIGVVVPLGFPRRLSSDEVYMGYSLPGGSIVIPNTWAILRDQTAYPNPEEFRPERFLTIDGQIDENIRDPDAAFGYGLRKCPGKYFAMEELFVTIASILAVFDITSGPARPGSLYCSGFLRYPEPFECEIKPRNDDLASFVRLRS